MDDDALNRAKRALAVVPRAGDNALTRAKRALAPADNKAQLDGLLERARAAARPTPPPAVIARDATRVEDLLTQARVAARPVEQKPAPPAVREQAPARIEPPQEAPRHSPPAVIASEPGRAVTPAPAPASQPAAAPAQSSAAPIQQTIVVQVAAPYPPYPYGYGFPWWSRPCCPHWNCPLLAGLPCRRWFCGW
jgi:hypothetical protein